MPKHEEPKPKADEKDTFSSIVEAIDAMEVEPDRHLSIQIDRALRDAVRAAQNSTGAASVTVKLTMKRDSDRRVTFAARVDKKLPNPPVSGVTLYADEAGHVHRSDPDQLRMDFPKPVPFPTPNKKDA